MAKHYTEIDVSKWNTAHFKQYLAEEHKRRYGINYVPFVGYAAEAGMLGDLIGTAKKSAMYDKALVKRFIDVCYDEYKPRKEYPGVSFGWMTKYMSRNLQRLEAEQSRIQNVNKAVQASDNDNIDELADWL